jgi:hypothetical protein
MANIARRPGQGYTEEQIDRALTEVALCGGNTHHAARNLKAAGMPVPRRTLRTWVERTQVERYLRLRAELVPRIHAKIAQECEDSAELAGQLERRMLAKLGEDFEKLPPRDQPGAIRNVATVKGINVDKAALLRGQPTEIVEHRRDVGELWAEFAAMFPSVVNGTAEEITDAGLVHGADSGADLELPSERQAKAGSASQV